MSIDLDIFRKAGVDGETDARAQKAVKAFRALQPTLTAYARILTKNPAVRVEMAARDNGSTDGKRIFFRPPIALGDDVPHERRLCDKRDHNKQLLCLACATREAVLSTIYHEIAHICYDSFEKTSDRDRAELVAAAIKEVDSKYAAAITKKIENTPTWHKESYIAMASLISEFLPIIVNALEDARVNSELFKARKGTKIMFDADVHRVFTEGVEQKDATGKVIVKKWNEYPLNLQAIVGIFCKASGYNYTDWFVDEVTLALDDAELTKLVRRIDTSRSAADVYHLSFPVLARLRELGYCRSKLDPQTDDDPQGEEDDTSEEGSTGSGNPEPDDSTTEPDDAATSSEAGSSSEGESTDSDEESEGSDDEADNGDAEDDSEEGAGSGDGEPSPSADAGGSEDGDADDSDDSESTEESDAGSGGQADPSADNDLDDDSDNGAGDEGTAGADQEAGDSSEGDGDLDEDSEGASEGDSGSDGAEGFGSEGDSETDSGDRGGNADASVDSKDHSSGSSPEDDDDVLSMDGRGSEPVGMAPSDDRGSGPDDEASDVDSVQESPEDDGEEVIDTGADDGTGGIEVVENKKRDRLPMGTPDECKAGLLKWGDHEEKPKTVDEGDMEDAVDRAIVQGIYFETPSRVIYGVRLHHYGQPIEIDGYNMSTGWDQVRQRALRMSYGIDGDFMPGENLLGPALLRMRVAFADNQRGKEVRGMKSGKVDAKVLGKRASHGDDRLFKRKTMPGKKNYFVVIGMDISGSTIGLNMKLEKRAVMAQAQLLSRMGIPFAIYGHSGNFHSPSSGRGEGLDLDVYLIKEEHEVWDTKTKERLENIGPDSANLDGHAMEFLRKKLDQSNATDKIIMYYSDGKMPAENHDEELEILQRELKLCKKKGYTVMGVGIRTDSPARHGLDTVQVDQDEDVVKVVKHLEKRLLSR